MSNTELVIAGVTIKTDSEGRFCLNDLKEVATVDRNKRTVEVNAFMRRAETIELIEEIQNTGFSRIKPVNSTRGRYTAAHTCVRSLFTHMPCGSVPHFISR